jgi:acetyltransferase-like isoleucine patch superfamily enzyme
MKEIDSQLIIRKKLAAAGQSPFRTYRDLTVGQAGIAKFIWYEIAISLFSGMPGGLGFLMRKMVYPSMFKASGRGLIIGRNVVIRNPQNIMIGNHVTIDDNCLIDARGAGDEGLVLEDGVIVNRNCMIQAKTGPIRLGARTSIGGNSVVVSMEGVVLGEAVLTAGGCYISAGSYRFDDVEVAVMDQTAYSKGPIHIGAKSWLGTSVIVLDGVSIGKAAVIGAGAVVTKNIPDYAIAIGAPARVVKIRGPQVFANKNQGEAG